MLVFCFAVKLSHQRVGRKLFDLWDIGYVDAMARYLGKPNQLLTFFSG